jgi:hypothetical protein
MESVPNSGRSKFWVWADRASLALLLGIGAWFVWYMHYCLPYFQVRHDKATARVPTEAKAPERRP